MSYEFYVTPEEYQIAFSNGISRKTLDQRIQNLSWDKQKAITQKPKSKKSIKQWIKLAECNGICEGTFLTRIRKLKWSEEKAATTPIINRGDLLEELAEKNRKYSPEIIELAKNNGISYKTFQTRVVRQKMSWNEAATIPMKSKEEISKMGKDAYFKIHGYAFGGF